MLTAGAPSRASRAPPSGATAIASAARDGPGPGHIRAPDLPGSPLPLLPIIDGVTAARSGGRARAVPPQPSPAA